MKKNGIKSLIILPKINLLFYKNLFIKGGEDEK